MINLQNKVVIVTGASSGMGRAAAREFGRAGARVAVAARRAERLEEVARAILAEGGEAVAIPTDVSRAEQVERLICRTVESFGRIDVLVNNAGYGQIGWLEQMSAAEVEAQFAVNVLGAVNAARLALPVMMRQGGGHIINVSSIAGLVGTPSFSLYAASKFALRGFSEGLRREAAPWGVKVSVLYPATVVTEFGQRVTFRRKRAQTFPAWAVLSAEAAGRAVVAVARRPRANVVLPWPLQLGVWFSQLFPGAIDYLTVRQFTAPEREEELRRAGRWGR